MNATGYTQAVVQLINFRGMWGYMTTSTVASLALLYGAMGCAASLRTSPRSTLAWLPGLAALLGACQGLAVGSVFAMLVSFVYLSIPYAIDVRVAVSLGLGLAVVLAYAALGRHHNATGIKARAGEVGNGPPHAADYGD